MENDEQLLVSRKDVDHLKKNGARLVERAYAK